jgi:hypothetical protein
VEVAVSPREYRLEETLAGSRNMGDSRRFDLFARFVANQVRPSIRGDLRVADVAAGKGYLSWALREHGFIKVVPFEPHPRRGGQVRRLGIRAQEFTPTMAQDFDLIVGMHPDEATDCMLSGAALHRKMVIVCPCCVRPNAWSYSGARNSHVDWRRHLINRSRQSGLELNQGALKMTGANALLWGGSIS